MFKTIADLTREEKERVVSRVLDNWVPGLMRVHFPEFCSDQDLFECLGRKHFWIELIFLPCILLLVWVQIQLALSLNMMPECLAAKE